MDRLHYIIAALCLVIYTLGVFGWINMITEILHDQHVMYNDTVKNATIENSIVDSMIYLYYKVKIIQGIISGIIAVLLIKVSYLIYLGPSSPSGPSGPSKAAAVTK